LLIAALISACSGGPPVMAPAPTGRIQGQPLLVMEISPGPLAPWRWCDGIERWVLSDDGHILFCDTLLTHLDEGSYRVAPLTLDALDAFLTGLPRERFRQEESMDTMESAADSTLHSVWLREGERWKRIDVVGPIRRPRGILTPAVDLFIGLAGMLPPPPAFAEIYTGISRIPLGTSVPLQTRVPAASGRWTPGGSNLPEDLQPIPTPARPG
jgi:hypothetical protein